MSNRPNIPQGIKRTVRIRCGYGCVICGEQPYDYDHIEDWAKAKLHEEHNITLLCKRHHGEKTAKILPAQLVMEHNSAPFNLRTEVTSPRLMYFYGNDVDVFFGSSIFTFRDLNEGQQFVALMMEDVNIIAFRKEGHHLLLSLKLYNRSNDLILEIIDNEISHSTNIWDCKWSANRMSIYATQGLTSLDIEFCPPKTIKITKGFLHYGNTDLLIDDDSMFVPTPDLSRSCIMMNLQTVGCSIAVDIQSNSSDHTIDEIIEEHRNKKAECLARRT